MATQWKVDPWTNQLLWYRLGLAGTALLRKKDIKRVLDLGGGSGWFAYAVTSRKPQIEVHSIDLEPQLIDNDVIHHTGDVLDLPFPDGHFQGITAHAILHHVPDQVERMVAEAWRVIEDGSYFVIEEPEIPFNEGLITERVTYWPSAFLKRVK